LKIVCANCEEQNNYEVEKEGYYSLSCSDCEADFQVIIGIARSKRSRGHKPSQSREYSIRFFQNGNDDFIQFESNCYDDVELKSKDIFVISSFDGKPRILANINIHKYWVINTKPTEIDDAMVMTAIVLFIFIGLVIVAMISAS
jgi:hypothetical protein